MQAGFYKLVLSVKRSRTMPSGHHQGAHIEKVQAVLLQQPLDMRCNHMPRSATTMHRSGKPCRYQKMGEWVWAFFLI